MTVLISGATGTTGGAVLDGLRAAGTPVRAMTRSETSAARFRADGVEAVVADLAAPESLAAAVAGADAVYVANPASPAIAEHEGNLARAAAAAGVGMLIKLSVVGASAQAPLGFGRLHHGAEQAIRASGVPCTMLRPNGFMQNTLAWAAQIPGGTVAGPVMDARWAIVDVRDIAAVAVAALRAPDDHAGETYTLTGPEPSSPREQVALIGELLGRELAVEDVPIGQAQQAMRDRGLPEAVVEQLGELWHLYADGGAQAISPDVERVTGRPARTYREFAEDHRSTFAGGQS